MRRARFQEVIFVKVDMSYPVLTLAERLQLEVVGIFVRSDLQRAVLQQGVAPPQHLLRRHILVDVVGLVHVERLVETLLSLEGGVVDNAMHKYSLDFLLLDGALVSAALPSQLPKQRPDDIDTRELPLGLEVALSLAVLGVYESNEFFCNGLVPVEEVLQHRLAQLICQAEVLPMVPISLQVIVGRGLPHIHALGSIKVFLSGEVLGGHDAAGPALHLRLLPPRRCLILYRSFFCGCGCGRGIGW